MKTLIALCAFFAVSTANVIITADPNVRDLGNDACTWGPSYWCENIKTSAECKMTKHCITSSWEHMEVPEDNDSVCNICKDMVDQARSQLESNQTQEDLKAVFEGSCKLIHIKPIVKECVSIVDEYIPDLVETLASQMNPSVVCTVAGLCNSARFDHLLEQHQLPVKTDEVNSRSLERDELEPDECSKCYTVATHMQSKLNGASSEVLLQRMLKSCAYLGTYSDACSSIVLTHFDGIQGHLRENFNAPNICHLSGQCSDKFHVHKDLGAGMNVEIKPLSSVGVVDINDDLPCKLCEQLVNHLRDLLVANTTEVEFEQVLKGFCKQTKSFANECTSIVDEYYPQLYKYLTKGLNSNAVCEMVQLCPAPGKQLQDEEMWPLVSKDAAEIGMRIFQEAKKNMEIEKPTELSKSEVEAMQLPIERLMPFPLSEGLQRAGGKESCALCENVLHYLQEAITNPATEDKVKQAVEKICKRLPQAVEGECSEFVENYGDALVAILAQQIDPSQICPMLRLCPSKRLMDYWQNIPEKYMLSKKQDKPTCSLCLLGIAQIYNVIKNNKTEANIQAALDKLCNRLPEHLKDQCIDFVQGYSKEIIELLLADLTPEEVCTYLKLCDATLNLKPAIVRVNNEENQILTNEIPDSTETDDGSSFDLNLVCSICQSVIREVHKRVGGEKNKTRVKQALRNVCSNLPEYSKECKKLVNDYGDKLVHFFVNKGIPAAACTIIPLCTPLDNIGEIFGGVPPVQNPEDSRLSFNPLKRACKHILEEITKRVGSNKNKARVKNEVHRVCDHLPLISGKCNQLISKHGDQIINLILQDAVPDAVCAALRLRNLDDSVEADGKLMDLNPFCSTCQRAMRNVEKQLGSDTSKDKVNNVVRGICSNMPQLSSECNRLINEHSDQIVDFIVQKGAPTAACTVVPLCFPADDVGQMIEGGITDDISGESRLGLNPLKRACKPVLEEIAKRVGSDKDKARAENEVHRVCNHLPWISGKCNDLISRHGDQIIDLILHDAVPDAVCAALRLRNLDASADDSEESRLSLNPVKALCRDVVKEIDKRVGSVKNRAKVVNEVHHICNHLPRISGKCNDLISKHGNQIIDLILKDAVPEAVCTALTLRNLDASADDSEESRLSLNPVKALCRDVVKEIDKRVGSVKNRAKVVNEVHHICNHLPRISGKCNDLISKHGNQIIDLILKDAVPEAVCTALTLRNLDASADDSEESRLSLNPVKALCRDVVKEIDKRVGSVKNRAKVVNEVHHICNHLPRISGKCNDLISKHGNQIIDLILKDAVPEAVCTALTLRNLDASADDSEESRLSLNPVKALCRDVVKEIDKRVGSVKNRAKVVNEVHHICNHLPWISGKCNDLISKHGDQIINLILQDAVPDAVCAALRLRNLDDSVEADGKLMDLNPFCSTCQRAMRNVEKQLGSDTSKDKVNNVVRGICSNMPQLSSECNRLINEHSDQIVDFIVQKGAPTAACTVVPLCFPADDVGQMIEGGITDDISGESRLGLNPLKRACKPVLEEIAKRVGSDKDKARAENEVHRVCNHLPWISGKCNDLISRHGDQIIDLILHDAVPDAVCAALRLRNLDASADDSEESRLSLNPVKALCRDVVKEIDKRVGSVKNRAKVVNEVHHICNHLPRISGKCNDLISKHGNQIIDLILKDAVPEAVCTALTLRNLDASADDSEESRLSLNPVKALCRDVVKEIDKRVGSVKNRAKVVNEVHHICNHLPRISGKCNDLISKHGNQIIDLILKDAVPEAVCTALTLRNLDASADDSEESRLSLNPVKALCRDVVKEIDKRVGSVKNRAKVVNEVHHICNHLPWISGKCNDLISKHGDQIIDLILHDAVPDAVCAALRLRNLDVSLETDGKLLMDINPMCSVCQSLMLEVEKQLGSDRSIDHVNSCVRGICRYAPSLSSECSTLINKHSDQIIDFIVKKGSPMVACTVVPVCFPDDNIGQMIGGGITDGMFAESRLSLNPVKALCRDVVKEIDKRVGSVKNRAKVVNEVHHICNHLPRISGKCNDLISKHGNQIIDLILKDAVPEAVCTALTLRNLDASADDSEESRLSLNPVKALCRDVVKEIDKRVGSVKNRAKVVNEVHHICNHLPRISGKCNDLISKHGNQIIDLILKDAVPEAVCTALTLRNLDASADDSEESRLSLNPVKALCRDVVKEIDKRVGSVKNRAKVVNEVHHICNHLPRISGKCNDLISKHGNQIIDLILKDAVPEAVCTALTLRNLDASADDSEESRLSLNPVKALCRDVVKEIDKRVGSVKNRAKVVNEVHHICNHLPRISGKCNDLISKHGNQIIDLILKDAVPEAVCTALTLRNLDASADDSEESRLSLNPVKALCRDVVKEIDKRVGSVKNRAKVVNEVHHICNHLPWISGKCNDLISKHGDQIIDLILHDAVPDAVCAALRLRNLDVSLETDGKLLMDINPMCSVCQSLMLEVEKQLGSDRSIDHVNSCVRGICRYAPSLSSECSTLINKHSDQIIDFIVKKGSPMVACTVVPVCFPDDNIGQMIGGGITDGMFAESRLSLNPVKALCRDVVKEIDKRVGSVKNRAKVVNEVHHICNHLPRISGKCNDLISKHGNQIIDLILKDAVPEAVCTALTLRNLDASADDSEESRLSLNPVKALCRDVVKEIDKRVGSVKNRAKVVNEVHHICNHLPWISGKCNDLISKHGDQIIDLILHDAVPDAVCAALRLRNLDVSLETDGKLLMDINPMCSVCQSLMLEVEKQLGSDRSIDHVNSCVRGICRYAPSLSSECSTLINKHSDQIIDFIVKKGSPMVACTVVPVCFPDDNIGQMIGGGITDGMFAESRLSLNPVKALCRDVVKEIDKRVGSVKNRAKVVNEVHHICNHLPRISGKCNDLISKHGNQIIDLILKDAVPEAVCTALTLRNLDASADDSEESRLSLNPVKALCRDVVKEIDKRVGSVKNRAKVVNEVHHICNHLPWISGKCNDLISKHGDQIIDLILHDAVPDAVCAALRLRNLDVSLETDGKLLMDINPMCSVCQSLMLEVEKQLGSDRSIDHVNSCVRGICRYAPSLSSECSTLINKHSDQIIDFIVKKGSPMVACTVVPVCFPDDNIGQMIGGGITDGMFAESRLSLNPVKALCRDVVKEIDKRVGSVKNRAKVVNEVHHICNHLPRISGKCNDLISKHGNQIIDLILKDAVPEAVCTALTLRNLDASADDSEESRLSLNPVKALCRDVVKEIDKRVGSVKNRAKVVNEVHHICNHLPRISGKCNDLISKHGNQIIDLILKDAVPEAVCTALTLRNLDASADDSEESRLSLNPVKALCRDVVKEIDKRVGSVKNRAKVVNEVHHICNHLPRISGKCNDLISKHGNQIIDLILKDAVPEAVCTALTLRNLDASADDSEESRLSLNPVKALCRDVVKEIDKRVGSVKNRAKVVNEVHHICNHLPRISGKCNDLISKHGNQIIDLILKDAVPEAVCTALTLRNLDASADDSEESRLSLNPVKALCRDVVKEIDKRVGSVKNRAKVVNEVHHICNHLPWISGKCNDLISKHGDQIIDLILHDAVPDAVCAALRLRNLDVSLETDGKLLMDINPMCSVCQSLMLEVEKQLGSDRSIDHVNSCVRGICRYAPSLSSECSTLINKHSDQIIDFIVKKGSPMVACTVVPVCFPDDNIGQMIGGGITDGMFAESRLSLNPVKALCRDVVKEIDKRVGSVKNRAKVVNEVHHICNHLPRISGKCNDLISKHGNQIIDLILKDAVPEAVCTALTLRNLDASADDSEESRLSLNPVKALCRDVVKEIDKRVGSVKNRAKVVNEVHHICNHLPRISGKCNDLISKHGNQIIDLILKDAVPEAVCTALTLRNLDASADDSEESRLSLNPVKALCRDVVKEIDKRVGSVKNRAKVVNEVHHICNHLPRISGKCNDLISKHGNQIIDLILKDAVPEAVCTALTLRNLDASADDSEESRLSLNPVKALCRDVVKEIDKRVGSVKNRAKVVNEVHHICNHLPRISGKCNDLISKHGNQIIDLILKDAVPEAVCTALTLRNLDASADDSEESRLSLNPVKALCRDVVKEIDKRVGSVKNRAKVVNEVHHICNHLPWISGKCNDLISKHGDQIIDLILHDAVPDAVCAALRLRNLDVSLETDGKLLIDINPMCSVCQSLMLEVEKQLGSDRSIDHVNSCVRGICRYAPSLSSECSTLINKHSDQIIDFIVKKGSPMVACTVVPVCFPDDNIGQMIGGGITDGMFAESRLSLNPVKALCRDVVKEIDKRVGSVKNRAKVVNEVHHICNHLPRISGKCNDLISKHGNQIIDLILKDAVPEAVCTALTLRNLDASADDSEESRLSLNPVKALCRDVVKEIDKRVGSVKNRAKVVNEVHHICNHLPWISGKCNDLISKHGDQIIDLILHDAVPDAVCAALRLRNLDVSVEVDGKLYPFVDINPICSICTSVMRLIEKQLGSDTSKDNVSGILRGICSYMPVLSSLCSSMVDLHSDQIVDFIVNKGVPIASCTLIPVCFPDDDLGEIMGGGITNGLIEGLRLSTNPLKAICEHVVEEIDERVGSDKDKAKVVNEVHHICNHLPRISGKCNELISKHGNQIIDLILQDAVPDAVCAALRLRSLDDDLIPQFLKASERQCAVCKAFISGVDELLGHSSVDQSIKNVVSRACKYVPSKYQSQCVSLVQTYGQSVINLIERHTATKEICGQIGLCTARDFSMISLTA